MYLLPVFEPGLVPETYTSYRLKYIEQPIMDNLRCVRFFPDYVTGTNICGDGEGDIGICDVRTEAQRQ